MLSVSLTWARENLLSINIFEVRLVFELLEVASDFTLSYDVDVVSFLSLLEKLAAADLDCLSAFVFDLSLLVPSERLEGRHLP